MQPTDIKKIIEENLTGSMSFVNGDGRHFEAIIVSAEFSGLSTLKRQQFVYKALTQYFSQGDIHALTMKTFTPDEWVDQKHKFHTHNLEQ